MKRFTTFSSTAIVFVGVLGVAVVGCSINSFNTTFPTVEPKTIEVVVKEPVAATPAAPALPISPLTALLVDPGNVPIKPGTCPVYIFPKVAKTPPLPYKELSIALAASDFATVERLERKHIDDLRLFIIHWREEDLKARAAYAKICPDAGIVGN